MTIQVLQFRMHIQELEKENQRMRDALHRTRIYAGDNLPANKGLTIVTMLEKALERETP